MPFYSYNQNNSGGSFQYDAARGISHWVIVEADNETDATIRAEQIGLYFTGYGDCSCCGNRWYDSPDSSAVPSVYSAEVHPGDLMPRGDFNSKWIDGYEGFIHYVDGRVEGFWAEMEPREAAETDGTYGYGVIFCPAHVTVFTCTKNGYDISGNLPAYSYDYARKNTFPPPTKKPVITTSSGIGWAWFSSREEAIEFAERSYEYIKDVQATTRRIVPPRGYAKVAKAIRDKDVVFLNYIDDYVFDEKKYEYVEIPKKVIQEVP